MSLIGSIFNFLRFNKKNWKAVVLCLFTAIVFWFFNALNKNYAANIAFPISFEYDQEKYIPVGSLPTSVKMNVSGLGWDLFRRSSGLKVPPLIIPLERPTEVRKIVGSTLPTIFSQQLERLKINFVLTDTVYLEIDQNIRKRVSLKVDTVKHFLNADFGILSDVKVTPDTVWLEGPQSIIKSMPDILPLALPRNNINRDFSEDVEVAIDFNELVKRNPPIVQVSFRVEKLIDVTDLIPLKIINAPARLRSAAGISEINCVYRLPASLASKQTGDSIHAVLDLKDIPGGTHKITPMILGLPKYSFLVRVDTVLINF